MSQLIFVTGATGFLGSHIVDQLLAAGYRVRAAARASKVDQIRAAYAKYGQDVEVAAISDISSDQFPEALKGVHAIIHSASPIAEKADTKEMLNTAVDGTLNVVRQAEKAGIRRIVVTSSIATVTNPKNSFTDKDWNPVTREDALEQGAFVAYIASKTLAEKALWEFADAHPNVDVTTINPPYMYGPFAEGFQLSSANYYAMSTNLYIYRLLSGTGPFPGSPRYNNVRDIAKVHVLALKSPISSESNIGRKRLVISSLDPFDYAKALALIREKRPELAKRLTRVAVPNLDKSTLVVPFDVQRVEDVVGFKKEDYAGIESTLLEAIDSILAIERSWVQQGHKINIPEI
ncbi:hypothetical protein C8J56DRAFT_358654 [Mycena floridula]|nr:hypothetical protein C8J56DRAFT_570566 [Mycena floridula]KAJ7578210.1 hypothetical protein C8J56DRAFT_358654 [Mycena floridula]